MKVFGFDAREDVNWFMVVYLGVCHLLTLVAMFRVGEVMWQTHLFAFVMYEIGALGITAGAHRLWAHRSYKATLPVRFFFFIGSCVANQGSLFTWCRNHRIHHKHSETDADPHNAKRGFFFSHVGWLLVRKHPKLLEAAANMPDNWLDDLKQDPLVMFQRRFDPFVNLFVCFVVPTVIPPLMWGESVATAFLWPGMWRYVFSLHCTWLVNSAAHMIGDRPYDPKINPAENMFVSLFAAGEGWHNWHHAYPYDYAASEFGISSQFNPTKLVIDGFAKLGLVSDRKRALGAWHAKQKNMQQGTKPKASLGG